MADTLKLTKSVIDRLPHCDAGQQFIWDSELPGFGVRIGATTKAYFVERRVDGRTVRATIGRHGPWTAEAARTRARELRVDMDKGINPIARARTKRAEETAKAVTLDSVFDSYIKTRDLKALTISDYERVMDEAFSDWRERPIVDITKDMVSERHEHIGKTSKARANLAMRLLRALFNYASAQYEDKAGQSLILVNPVKRLSQTKAWHNVERRRTYIKPNDLKPWFKAVLALGNTEKTGEYREKTGRFAAGGGAGNSRAAMIRDFLLFLLFTGFRRSEAETLTWDCIDFKARTLTIQDTKNREPHTLPMPPYLVALLRRREADANASAFVFHGSGAKGHLVEPRKQMERVTLESGVPFQLHDLRRTFITIAESLDIPMYAIKRLANHKMSGDVTAGYIVTDVERLRAPMDKIANFILKSAGVTQKAKPAKSAKAPAKPRGVRS
jgi:integrase